MTRILGLVSTLLLMLAAPPAHAQYADMIPGALVRVRAPAALAGKLEGIITARTDDSVSIARRGGPPITLAHGQLSTVEIARGRSRVSGMWTGMRWGGGIGIGLGLLGAVLYDREDYCDDGQPCDAPTAVEEAARVVAAGASLGAMIGWIVGRERWEKANLSVGTSITPVRGEVVVAARRAW